MDDKEYDIDCAVDTLIKAEEIKKDPELMAKVLAKVKSKGEAIKSIAGLRKKAEEMSEKDYGVKPELMTEEDKAAIQEEERVDGKLKEMGMLKKKSK